MEKDDNFLIHVQIGGLKLPLRILRQDEEVYRKAERMLNRYLSDYQAKFNQRSTEEILFLVAYQLAVIVAKKETAEDVVPIAERLKKLDQELQQLLGEN